MKERSFKKVISYILGITMIITLMPYSAVYADESTVYNPGSSNFTYDYDGINSYDPNKAGIQDIVDHNGEMYALQNDYTGDTNKVRIQKYNGSGWEYINNDIVSSDGYSSSMVFYKDKLYVAFVENLAGSSRLKVKGYNTTGWKEVGYSEPYGINVSSSDSIESHQLIVFKDKLYAIFVSKDSEGYKVRVLVYDDGQDNWNEADGGIPLDSHTKSTSFRVTKTEDAMYVAINKLTGFDQYQRTFLSKVIKFDGISWSAYGGEINNLMSKLVVYNNELYAFESRMEGIYCRKYDVKNNQWVQMTYNGGNTDFEPPQATYYCSSLTNVEAYNGKLYISTVMNYWKGTVPYQTYVAAYDGTNLIWIGGSTTIRQGINFDPYGEYVGAIKKINGELLVFGKQKKATDSNSFVTKFAKYTDSVAPVISFGTASRISSTSGAIKITTNEPGYLYYTLVDDGAPVPDIDTSGMGIFCNSFGAEANIPLTDGEKDIYVTVKDAAGNNSQIVKYDIPAMADTTPPVITSLSAIRSSDVDSSVRFTVNESGKYYYKLMADGAAEPTAAILTGTTAFNCTAGENVFTPSGLTVGNKDLYLCAKDVAGNISDVQKVDLNDTVNPVISDSIAGRSSDTAAQITFTSSEAGSSYYVVVDDNQTAPVINTGGTGTACIKGANTIDISGLTAGAKDLYLQLKDKAGNLSTVWKVDIDAAADTTIPVLSQNNVKRTAPAYADITFESSEAGSYYYLVTTSAITDSNLINTTGVGSPCQAGLNTFNVYLNTSEAMTVCIIAKDKAGNLSQVLSAYVAPYQVPAINDLAAMRNSPTTAYVKLTSTVSGNLYCSVVNHGDPVPVIDTSGAGISVEAKILKEFTVDNLTEGDKDIYFLVKDLNGAESSVTKGTIWQTVDDQPPVLSLGTAYRLEGGTIAAIRFQPNEFVYWDKVVVDEGVTPVPPTVITYSACTINQLAYDEIQDLTSGAKDVYIYAKDKAGNAATPYKIRIPAFEESDTTKPVLSEITKTRISDDKATVAFVSNETGTYYYKVLDSVTADPGIDTSGAGTPSGAMNTISMTGLSAGVKYLYVQVKDAAGNVSEPLQIVIGGYQPVVPNLAIVGSATSPNLRLTEYTKDGTTYNLIEGLNPMAEKVSQVMSYFNVTNGTVKTYKWNPTSSTHTEVASNDSSTVVGTNFKIELYDTSNNLVKTYYVVIRGDVNCSGTITTTDTLMVKNHVMGKVGITNPIMLYSADMNKSNTITTTDTLALKNHVMGKVSIVQ
ncbi:dockerin type I domain-containing protein [Aminipila sp.]|uniref:dockerin type I domain-containing protein n=1 Tax=Aminipila sp. TaxID=2060095 RepID=UPI0028A2358C|nr:dockerin type I domain-containing protein [Aminipila sp.]